MKSGGKVQKNKNNFLYIILFVIFIIIIAVSTILIIKNHENSDEITEGAIWYDESAEIYTSYLEKLNADAKNLNSDSDVYALLDLYKKYLPEITDERAKAMFKNDYFALLMTTDLLKERQDEVIGGLIEVDDVLATQSSALAVLNAAYFYNDSAITEKYTNILHDRGFEGEAGLLTDSNVSFGVDIAEYDEEDCNDEDDCLGFDDEDSDDVEDDDGIEEEDLDDDSEAEDAE